LIEKSTRADDLQDSEYLRLNPNARIPTLVDGDLVLWESTAMAQDVVLAPRCVAAAAMQKREPRNEIALPNDREPVLMRSSRLLALLACLSLAACEAQRARLVADAQASMVGRTKEQVLACMGPPAGKATEGAAEIWSYVSGDGSMDTMQSSG